MIDLLTDAFANTPCPLRPAQATAMARYFELLSEANKTMNLTAIHSQSEAVNLHFLDSASALFHPVIFCGARCADVGSGAGFPGMVLAILRADCAFVLMDAQQKRVEFLRSAIEALGLENASALHVRAEDAGRALAHRERYDVALARAVAPLRVLCEYCLPLLRVGGRMVAYKGPTAQEEAAQAVRAAKTLGGGDAAVLDAAVPGRSHRLVCYDKVRPTPKAYPRKAGAATKKPL
jgi:16S rRNA (guanine527-N7)-methyltransferase